MSETGWYSVTFTGDYFTLTTAMIDADDEEQAIRLASSNIKREYGWDIEAVANEITVELEATYE
jgi:hypothetical protein